MIISRQYRALSAMNFWELECDMICVKSRSGSIFKYLNQDANQIYHSLMMYSHAAVSTQPPEITSPASLSDPQSPSPSPSPSQQPLAKQSDSQESQTEHTSQASQESQTDTQAGTQADAGTQAEAEIQAEADEEDEQLQAVMHLSAIQEEFEQRQVRILTSMQVLQRRENAVEDALQAVTKRESEMEARKSKLEASLRNYQDRSNTNKLESQRLTQQEETCRRNKARIDAIITDLKRRESETNALDAKLKKREALLRARDDSLIQRETPTAAAVERPPPSITEATEMIRPKKIQTKTISTNTVQDHDIDLATITDDTELTSLRIESIMQHLISISHSREFGIIAMCRLRNETDTKESLIAALQDEMTRSSIQCDTLEEELTKFKIDYTMFDTVRSKAHQLEQQNLVLEQSNEEMRSTLHDTSHQLDLVNACKQVYELTLLTQTRKTDIVDKGNMIFTQLRAEWVKRHDEWRLSYNERFSASLKDLQNLMSAKQKVHLGHAALCHLNHTRLVFTHTKCTRRITIRSYFYCAKNWATSRPPFHTFSFNAPSTATRRYRSSNATSTSSLAEMSSYSRGGRRPRPCSHYDSLSRYASAIIYTR